MQEAMEADQNKPLYRSGSFYVAEDSFLLSDYLHRQAEKAGNRFFNNTNSLIFLRSTLLLSELEQKEDEENSDRCCPPELKSMPLGLSAAHKESSESFTGRECSSRMLPELEQEKGNASLPHRILASSVSYVESSECCESVEAATRIEANSDSLHNNMLCHESRQAISLSIDEEEVEDAGDDEDGTAEEVLTASLDSTEALNLLVIAAMQVDNDDEDNDHVVGTESLKRSNSPSERDPDASAVHGNSFILKRKVIRRAKSAFQKQNCDDQLRRLELSEAATRAFEKKAKHAVETHREDLVAAQVGRKSLVGRTKRRKLRDLSLDPSYAVAATCTDVDEDLERNHSEGGNWPTRCFGDVKEEISDVENFQVLPAKIASSMCTEASKLPDENHGHFVNHRKLQVSSARLLDAYNAEHSKGLQMQGGQPRLRLKLENYETPTSSKNGLSSKGVTRACTAREEMRKSSMERLEIQEEEACLGIAQLDDTMKSASSVLRLKILPIRLPTADLPLLQEVSKSESTEVVLEDRMVTRKRRCLSSGEHGKATVTSESMLPKEVPMPDIQVKDGDPVIRSKRGRSQVLPTKFSDSVLQPWKSSRKKCK